MSLRRRLLVFGYPALELITLFALIQWIGLGWVLAILALGAVVGFAIMQTAGRNAFAALREAAAAGSPPVGPVRRHGMFFLSGALIAIPGIWCKVAGVLLMIPVVQDAVARRSAGRLGMRMRDGGVVVEGTVVEGTVIRDPDMRTGPTEAGPVREIE